MGLLSRDRSSALCLPSPGCGSCGDRPSLGLGPGAGQPARLWCWCLALQPAGVLCFLGLCEMVFSVARENFPCDSTVIWEDALGTSLVPPPMALSLRHMLLAPVCPLSFTVCGILWPWPHGPPSSRGWWLPVSGALRRVHVRGSGSRLGFCSTARSPGLVGPLGSSHVPFCHHRLLLGSVETAPRGALRPPRGWRVVETQGFGLSPSLPSSFPCVSCVLSVSSTDVPDYVLQLPEPAGTQCCFPAPSGWLSQTDF